MSEPLEQQRKIDLKAVISFFIILGLITLTVLGMILMKLNQPAAVEKSAPRVTSVVKVFTAETSDHLCKIQSQGSVESVRETILSSEVSGLVIEISPKFEKGGLIQKGETLLQIDPADYRAAVASAEVRLRESELELEIETARMKQALLDWKKIGRGEPQNALVLREPYFAAAKARKMAAEQELARAQRNLERTKIIAPFDAAIRSKEVEIGSFLATGMRIASIYSYQDLEIRLPVSIEDLGSISSELSEESSPAILKGKIGSKEYEWKAKLSRVDPEISREILSGHMVFQIITSSSKEYPLPPVGLFVSAEIQGKTLQNILEIPRKALIGSNQVMLANANDRLEFRTVTVARMNQDRAVISEGLKSGERIITTRLTAPVEGLLLQIENPETDSP